MSVRLTRPEQAEATRRRILDAARAVFTDRGFHAASLDAVAEEAGFTKGAVYSRFDSKADLFLAMLQERIESRIVEMREAAAAVRGPLDLATTLSRQWDERLEHDEQWSLLSLEFRLHAARNPALNRRYAALHARLRRAIAALIEAERREADTKLSVSPEDVARSVLALGTGLVLERCAEGAGFPRHLTEIASRAMVSGLEPAAEGSAARPSRRKRA